MSNLTAFISSVTAVTIDAWSGGCCISYWTTVVTPWRLRHYNNLNSITRLTFMNIWDNLWEGVVLSAPLGRCKTGVAIARGSYDWGVFCVSIQTNIWDAQVYSYDSFTDMTIQKRETSVCLGMGWGSCCFCIHASYHPPAHGDIIQYNTHSLNCQRQ